VQRGTIGPGGADVIEIVIGVAYEVTNLTTARSAARAHTVLVITDDAGKLQYEMPQVLRARLGV
jgi:hypothetical protein